MFGTSFLAVWAIGPLAVIAAFLAQIDFPQVFGDNLALSSLVVGFLLPILIAAINKRTWPSETKGATTFVICALAAVLLVYVQGLVDPTDWLRSFLIIFVMAIFVWNQFYKPSQIGPNIERAING